MEINAYYLHVAIFMAAIVYFYHKFVLAQRENASFKMYKVRDEFVYLVASDVMTETDPVFSYYYKRINSILAMAPNIGIDDVLHAIFNNASDIDRAIEKTRKEVEKIMSSPSAQNEDVKRAMESYYICIKQMMLSHSSILRIIFILAKRFNPFKLALERLLPKNNSISEACKVMEYAEREVCVLHGAPC
jgi:hypothetical protein